MQRMACGNTIYGQQGLYIPENGKGDENGGDLPKLAQGYGA